MIFSRPRIAAIDDQEPALIAIADALNGSGAACLKLQYAGALPEGTSLDQVRVLFMDLHLGGPAGNTNQDFSTIGGLLQEFIPKGNGPFVLIVWTVYPPQVDGLMDFLCQRLREHPHAIPVQVRTLSKIDHIRDNEVIDRGKLVHAVREVIEADPRVAALVNWEARVTSAASETIAALLALVPPDKRAPADLSSELDRLLSALATEAVGASNVAKDRFVAVNEALLPMLYDRISRLTMDEKDAGVWEGAISNPGGKATLSSAQAALLNSMLHVDFETHGSSQPDRGMVLEVPEQWLQNEEFEKRFGMRPRSFLNQELGLKPTPAAEQVKWVLVQVEAVCDHAQAKPGPVPYLLGVEAPALEQSRPPGAAWKSPLLWIDSSERVIYLNFRFGVLLLDSEAKRLGIRFRLREALTNEIVSRMHAYGARPGMIAFRALLEQQAKTAAVDPGPSEIKEQADS